MQDSVSVISELPLPKVYTKRVGLRWQIFTKHSDGIERPLNPVNAKFWRWITAARIAGQMQVEIGTAAYIALEYKK